MGEAHQAGEPRRPHPIIRRDVRDCSDCGAALTPSHHALDLGARARGVGRLLCWRCDDRRELAERTTEATSRGKVFGVYTMVNLAATTAGQMVLTLGDATGYLFFVLAAMVYCLALLPTAISATSTPKPLTQVSLDLPKLWRNSPIAVFAVFMVGISNAAFGTLAAVDAARIGLTVSDFALFASLPILAGAASQISVGFASHRFDRRKVLLGIAVLAVAADALFLFYGVAALELPCRSRVCLALRSSPCTQ